MGCDGVLVGGGVWLVGKWCLVGVPLAAPGPHPNPLPSNGRGGMFVADECVAAVMDGRGGLVGGPHSARAYPARGAPLARAPFALRKGRGCAVG